jgi:uncharacterized protein
MLEECIKLLKPKVEELFKSESSGHDMSHLERVMNIALYIQSKEGGDRIVVGISAFLHDIHRLEQNKTGKYCSPKESLPIIDELLKEINLPKELTDKVLNAIEYHEVYNWNQDEIKTTEIEALILQDADNVDGTGAMGIARTFAYAGAKNIPLHDSNSSIEELCSKNYKEGEGKVETPIELFRHKLLKLGKHMNTKTAKKLTKERDIFMKQFIDEFIKEWDGIYES